MFSQFDIDYDKITINGVVLPKPRGVPVQRWEELAKSWLDVSEGFSVEDAIKEALEERGGDVEREVEHALDERDDEWSSAVDKASNLVWELLEGTEFQTKVDDILCGIDP